MCVQTYGGFGFAEEYDVERKFREARLYQVAPISTNLILSYIAEHVLKLPRSYDATLKPSRPATPDHINWHAATNKMAFSTGLKSDFGLDQKLSADHGAHKAADSIATTGAGGKVRQ